MNWQRREVTSVYIFLLGVRLKEFDDAIASVRAKVVAVVVRKIAGKRK